MISRKLLCAATLACLAPLAASAADGYLTPGKNGGSGEMPSGYTKLYFELADNDFVADVKLPANPRHKDRVELSSMARNSSRIDASGTSVADLVYVPVDSLSNYTFLYSDNEGRWMVTHEGLSSTRVVINADDRPPMPVIEHNLVDMHVGGTLSHMPLPSTAPVGAALGVVNYSKEDFVLSGPELAESYSICRVGQSCAFVFDGGDGKWHARRGRARFQPTEPQLPVPAQRWTDIVTDGAAFDLITPREMLLPTGGIEGDILQFTDLSDSHFFKVHGKMLTDKPLTFRFDSQSQRWVHQPR